MKHPFNIKYADYIEDGFGGLYILYPEVVEYLDKLFSDDFIHRPGFKFSQIKLKFNWVVFHCEGLTREEITDVETSIRKILQNVQRTDIS
jgi:hypothetical protein